MTYQILVVDDDADLRSLLQELLLDAGYSVALAATGEEALAQLTERPPDLLLLDLALPGMAGWDLASEMRDRHLSIPIILMTGRYEAGMEADLCGADGALAKPFDLDEVLAVVARWTAQRVG